MPDTKKIAKDIYLQWQKIKQAEGKFKHKPYYTYSGVNIYTIRVDEYICPDGSDGIDVRFIKVLNKKIYQKVISFGSEKDYRENAWHEMVEDEF